MTDEEKDRVQVPSASIPPGARGGLSLGAPRLGRGRGRGRGGGTVAGGPGGPSSRPSQQEVIDGAVRATDDDALGSRLSAIEAGYLPPDPFSRLFLSTLSPLPSGSQASTPPPTFPVKSSRGISEARAPAPPSPPPSSATVQGTRAGARRPPIINIGTYLRCRSIDDLVERFLADDAEAGKKKQIISLGAGSDSRFWKLSSRQEIRGKVGHYMEIDFEQVVRKKIDRIRRSGDLSKALGDEDVQIDEQGKRLLAPHYSLLSQDLRSLASIESALDAIIPDTEAPTLILAECVLAYLDPRNSRALLDLLRRKLKRPAAICYEMCIAGPSSTLDGVPAPSRFGNVMLSNLEARSLVMPGARSYSTPTLHAKRFQDAFGPLTAEEKRGAHAMTLKQVWLELDGADRDRISRLEGLDEVEELEILLDHYAVSWYGIA